MIKLSNIFNCVKLLEKTKSKVKTDALIITGICLEHAAVARTQGDKN